MAICRIFQQSSLILKLSLLENCEILGLSWQSASCMDRTRRILSDGKTMSKGQPPGVNESRVKEQLLPGKLADGSAGLLLK
jgi:hypothetical protein